MAKVQSSEPTLSSLIIGWKLSKVQLAARMGMPAGTFKNKLSETQTAYKFADEEAKLLTAILVVLSGDINKLSGVMTYNEAVSFINSKESERFEQKASEAEYKRHFKKIKGLKADSVKGVNR